jgi:hybrid cluster-associated redox disulfide protein
MKTKIKKPEKKKAEKKPSAKRAITKNMTFAEILQKHPESADVLFESGLHCIGCGMAMYETLEQGCIAHGMNQKEIDAIVDKVNKANKK